MSFLKKTLCTVVPLCAALLLTGCHINFSLTGTKVSYPNAEKYQAGDVKINETVDELCIHWISGGVELLASESDTVRVRETGAPADEALKLHYWLDGSTLHVEPCASGTNYPGTLSKTLTVMLPERRMDLISVDGVSCNIEITALEAKTVSIDTVSGAAELKGCTVTDELKMDSTSGALTAYLRGTLDAVDFDSVSGAAKIEAEEIMRVDFDTTSGAMELNLEREPETLNHSSTSGDLSLTLPEDANFELEFDTVSGSLKSDIPVTKSGDTYIAGSGGNDYSVDTTSGSVRIYKG